MMIFYYKGFGGRTARVIGHYEEANNIQMLNYDKTKKTNKLSILVLKINIGVLYRNHFLVEDLNL